MRTMTRWVSVLMIAGTWSAGGLADDCSWEWVNPVPPRVDIYRLKHEVGAFVGVGRSGTIIRSVDGFDWTVVDSGVSGDLFGVDWGAGTFVVVGDGAVLTSSVGLEWSPVYEDEQIELADVEFSVSRFVAVGDGLDGHVLTSTLGSEWELVPVPWNEAADSIAGADDGFYVAVGIDLWYSPNGFDWEYIGAVPAVPRVATAHEVQKRDGSDMFELDRIDLGWTGSRLFWSGASELWSRDADSGKWELAYALGGCQPWSDWLGLASGPGWVVASGISGCPTPYLDPTVTLLISTDGGASFRDPWQTELGGFPAMARYGARWVAAGAYGDIVTSPDATTWECIDGGCSSLACADGFADLVEADDGWLAVGGVGLCDGRFERRSGATTATSTEGESWQVHGIPGERFRGAAVADAGYVGVGDGWIAHSPDGETWTTETSPGGKALFGAGSGNGSIVIVGQGGALYVSEDGTSWFEPFLYVDEDLERVVWDGEYFFALGRAGTVLRSGDALNWELALTTTEANLKGVAAGPEQRIMVGDGGTVLAGDEGDVWVPRRSGVAAHLGDVTWAEGLFVAVGWDDAGDGRKPSIALASTDGVHWTRFDLPGEELHRVRWTGDSWIAIGGERTLLRADCLPPLIALTDEHLQVPVGETVDLGIRLSEPVDHDTTVAVKSSRPGRVEVPQSVIVPAGTDAAYVAVTGTATVTRAVITVALPDELGGGSTTGLVSVQPPEWTPRTPSGRVTP